jgi:hypothetical protein
MMAANQQRLFGDKLSTSRQALVTLLGRLPHNVTE